MRRAHAGLVVAAVALLVVPAGAAAVGPPGAVRAALPVPQAAQPRLGFVDRQDVLREVTLDAPVPVPPDGGGGIGLVKAAPRTDGAQRFAALGPLRLASVPIWDPTVDADVVDLSTGHRHDGEASVRVPVKAIQNTVWVSTARATDPTDPGDVFYADLDPEAGALPTDRQVTCDPAQESHPVLSPDGRWVAYATDARGGWDIAVAPVPTITSTCDPEDVTYVTGGATQDTWPAWLDSDQLVYAGAADGGRPDLYRVGRTGGTPVQLTDTPEVSETQPSAQPISGGWELVATTTEFRPDGSLVDLLVSDAATPTVTVRDPYADSSFPRVQGSEGTFSPEGQIAFTSTADDAAGDVWVTRWTTDEGGFLHVAGAGPVVARHGVAESHPGWVNDFLGTDTEPAGAQLVFTEEVPSADVSDVVAADGSDLRAISAPGASLDGDLVLEAGVDYSPDGTQVAYSVPAPFDDETPGAAAAVVAVYGHVITIADARTLDVVDRPYDRDDPDDVDLDPTWSPDGTTIAFVRWHYWGDGYELPQISLLDVASGDVTQLTGLDPEEDNTWAVDPSWSPDGSRIVYATGTGQASTETLDDESDLAVVDVGTRDSTLLRVVLEDCDGPDVDCPFTVQGRSPAWSPDGTQIAAADLVAIPRDYTGCGCEGPLNPLVLETPGGIGVLQLASATGPPEIVATRALTGVATDGTATPTEPLIQDADDPEWSPDGTRVAFAGVPLGFADELRGVWEVAAADGSDLRRVADPAGPQREPAYQPYTDVVLALASSAVAADGTATLTATATNTGPGLVGSATVTFALPTGVTTTGAPGCTVAAAEVACDVTGPVAVGAAATVELPVSGVAAGAPSTVTAVVVTPTPELVVTNNTASVDLALVAGADVAVAVALSAPVAWVEGRSVTATITVTNAGPQPAQDVTLAVTYPGTVTPSGLAPCAAPTGTCALGALTPGGAVVLTATLTPDVVFEGPPRVGEVVATVATTTAPDAPANDRAAATLEVRRPHVALAPAVARPNEVVFAVGTDFPPGEQVGLTWSSGIMSLPGPFTAGPDGRWHRSLLILNDGLVTARDLRARSTLPDRAYGEVSAPLLVVPTSIDAPTFLFRK